MLGLKANCVFVFSLVSDESNQEPQKPVQSPIPPGKATGKGSEEEKNKKSSCIAPQAFIEADKNVFYQYVDRKLSHGDALNFCKKLGSDGLAKVRSEKEKQAILNIHASRLQGTRNAMQ